LNETPNEIGRNEFDEWCWRRGLELRDVVDGLALVAARLTRETGRVVVAPSVETVRRIRMPFSDARRRVPSSDLIAMIKEYTGGAVVPAHFYPENLRGTPAPAPEPLMPAEGAA
jgi:hypothetical protein